ncbi:hypothetical protein CH373_13280 [Leptospira perolatii]|uniref:Peptidase n=1 Tax=Leptospira perolatii TaxID=2023191 RepID=A0A2M9ZL54_9LEPT|nr:hypothetical protein [Leptospira perolatii]PJZ69919.1 hypothetical protein CH360_08405 [Leptospira perolatii]PJZ72673.1 hypothetical protein CH373_13280 [Leptospira perolatii]
MIGRRSYYFIVILVLFAPAIYSLKSESIRIHKGDFDFYYIRLKKQPRHERAEFHDLRTSQFTNPLFEKKLEEFSDLFLDRFKIQSEQVHLKGETNTVLVLHDSFTFSQYSGKPKFLAAFYEVDRRTFYFQNPDTLYKRNILYDTIDHEICHFLSPSQDKPESHWLEESYCESKFPTSSEPAKDKKRSRTPKFADWKAFKKSQNKNLSNGSQMSRVSAYRFAYEWGQFLRKAKGEDWFRDCLSNHRCDSEFAKLYQRFIE